MAERAEHGVGERALVPRAVVAAAVDEERRREHHAARPRARLVGGNAGLRLAGALAGAVDVVEGNAELLGDGCDVVFGEYLRAAHQRDVSVPELVCILGALDEDRGAAGEAVVAYRTMAKDIAQPLAELVADFGDALVGGAAMGAGVAAVFDQRDRRRLGSKRVILWPHAPVESIAVASVGARHPIASRVTLTSSKGR